MYKQKLYCDNCDYVERCKEARNTRALQVENVLTSLANKCLCYDLNIDYEISKIESLMCSPTKCDIVLEKKLQEVEDKYISLLEILKSISLDYCHKSNCYNCPAYVSEKDNNFIKEYFNEDGELTDEEGTLGDALDALKCDARRSCTRGKYLADTALADLQRLEEVNSKAKEV